MEGNIESRKASEEKESLLPKAKKYQRIQLKLRIAKVILWIGFLLFLLFTGVSSELRNSAETINSNPWMVVFIYLIGLGFITEILFLPLSYYSGYSLEHRFGLSTENRLSWAKDYIKAFVINLALMLILVEALYYFTREFEKWWWLIASFCFTLFFILLVRLAPTILFPLFFKFKTLEDKELKERLLLLFEESGIRVIDVMEMDLSRKSKTANAALAGLGGSRRIILSDTLISKFTKDEIATVLAHELGHYVHRHLWKGILLQSGFSLIGFYLLNYFLIRFVGYFDFYGISDVASFPILMLVFMALGIILMPLSNLYSRRHEYRADLYALQKTENAQAFISAMTRLAELNLADPHPNPIVEFLFYSHPSIGKRIKMAQTYDSNMSDFHL